MATTPTPNPSTSPLSVDEFASRIKTKYPEYQSLDNATLAQKIVAKYPEYKGKVNLVPSAPETPASLLTAPQQMERAKNRDYGQTSMSAGTPKPAPLDPYATQPNTAGSFLSHAGIPTSQPAATEAVRGILTPQSDPAHDAISRAVERVPIIGGDQRARYDLYQQGDKEGGVAGFVHKAAAMVPFAGPAVAASQDAMDKGDYAGAAGSGVNAFLSMLGLKSALTPKPVANSLRPPKTGQINEAPLAPRTPGTLTESPNAPTATQEAAFNVLHPENAVAPKSILGDVRNAAAQQGVTKVPKGRAGVELPQRVIQGSIDNHETQVQAIKNPYRGAVVDNSSAADAALSKITPEMRASAARGDSGVQRAISQIEDVAARAKNANTIDAVDQLRHSWNDELSSELSKSAASQDVSPAATQAKRAAASALRSNMYDRLADLSGRDDVRALAQREGALIEAKAGVMKTAETALKNKGNDKSFVGRVLTGSDRDVGGVSSVMPAKASMLEIPANVLRAIGNKSFGTPIGDYQARVMRSLGNLGPAAQDAPLYQVSGQQFTPPNVPPLTPPNAGGLTDIIHPGNVEMTAAGNNGRVPLANNGGVMLKKPLLLGQGDVTTPPNASGTVEHVPYNSQANASTLPNAIRVPKQIGAGPDIRGLLPPQVESAIGLPEKSQSTLTSGRTIESPVANEGAVPGLVRDYVNGRQNTSGVSGHNSITGGSLEEIQRGNTIKVNPKTGTFGSHGGSIDVGNGEAVLRQRPDGTLEVANNNSGVADSEILKRFAPNAAQVYGKPGRAPNTIELIHRGGEHGDVPVNRVADYLGSGEYRLAPRR